MRKRYSLVVIAAILSIGNVNSVTVAEDEISWSTWLPGDKGSSTFLVVVSTLIDESNLLVTPLNITDFTLIHGSSFCIIKSGKAITAADILQDHNLNEVKQPNKQFVISGVPTAGYLEGQVLGISGMVSVSKTQDSTGRTLSSIEINGDIKPSPRKDDDPLEYTRETEPWSWRPGTVGMTYAMLSVEEVIDPKTALVIPLYYDSYPHRGITASLEKARAERSKPRVKSGSLVILKSGPGRFSSKAFDQKFLLTDIPTAAMVDGTTILLHDMVQIEQSEQLGRANVRRLSPADSKVALRKLDYLERVLKLL